MSTIDEAPDSCETPKLPPPSQEEVEAKKKYDEFWKDPCWTGPLEINE